MTTAFAVGLMMVAGAVVGGVVVNRLQHDRLLGPLWVVELRGKLVQSYTTPPVSGGASCANFQLGRIDATDHAVIAADVSGPEYGHERSPYVLPADVFAVLYLSAFANDLEPNGEACIGQRLFPVEGRGGNWTY